MKQYLDTIQTLALIELGFPQPKSVSKLTLDVDMNFIPNFSYSIGELIEMLGVHLSSIYYIGIEWFVNAEGIECRKAELINALYDMIVKLIEEGVI